MGEPPTPKHQIDRIDNNKLKNGYSPKNCRWVLPTINARNRRNNIIVQYNNKTQCATTFAEVFNIPLKILLWRLKNDWSVEKALITPVRKYKKRK